jgi:hypothetical protein
MMRSRHGVNDPGGRGLRGSNESIRISLENKGFIPLARQLATASFFVLDSRGLASM